MEDILRSPLVSLNQNVPTRSHYGTAEFQWQRAERSPPVRCSRERFRVVLLLRYNSATREASQSTRWQCTPWR